MHSIASGDLRRLQVLSQNTLAMEDLREAQFDLVRGDLIVPESVSSPSNMTPCLLRLVMMNLYVPSKACTDSSSL